MNIGISLLLQSELLKLNERSYRTSNNANDWNTTLPHLYSLLDLTQTPTRLKY